MTTILQKSVKESLLVPLFSFLLLFSFGSHAQTVTTLAGGIGGYADGTGTEAQFSNPFGLAVASDGMIYVADQYNFSIRKITPAGVVTTWAGSPTTPGPADGTGTAAQFTYPCGITIASDGTVYVADTYNFKIRKITPAGVVTTLAGSEAWGTADGTGTAAQFHYPIGIAVAADGMVYVSENGSSKIRKITPEGVVTTFAGNGASGYTDGTGTAAQFNYPYALAIAPDGTLYVADTGNNRIRKITQGGVVTTFAGDGTAGSADGTGTAAQLNQPQGLTVGPDGNIYVSDSNNSKIRKITPEGVVTTFAGSGISGYADGTASTAQFGGPRGIGVAPDGTVYVVDGIRIRKIENTPEVQPVPTITSFAPISGNVGTVVTIEGTNFNTAAQDNVVFFGATRAVVTNATATTLTVTVPVGATCSEITLFNGTLATASLSKFTPTFSPVNPTITASDFDPKIDIAPGNWPYQVQLGDIDGDGKSELVVANRASYSVSVFRNISTSGSINFAPKVDFATAQEPRGLTLADIDGDGKLDISTTGGNLNQVAFTVLRNTSTSGTIGFAPKVETNTATATYSVASADVDSDGKIDLIFGGPVLKIYRNTSAPGTVSFDAPADFPAVSDVTAIDTADFDGDGKKDICVTTGNNLTVLRNLSSYGTIALDAGITFPTYYSVGVDASDHDGDGKPEIAVTLANNTNKLNVYHNTSSAGSISFDNPLENDTPQNPYGIASGDLNGDGNIDLITSNAGQNGTAANISLFQDIDESSLYFNPNVNLELGTWPYYVTIGDIDGDGIPEVVSSSVEANIVSIYRGHPQSSNALLSNLTTTAGDLNPVFDSLTTNYAVASSVNPVTITPTLSDGTTATVQVSQSGSGLGYVPVTNGVATSPYTLVEGENTIHIKAIAQDGTEKYYSITIMFTLGVDDFDNQSFKYYPNVVRDVLNISYTKELRSVKVFDMIGQEVYSKNINNTETAIDMSTYPAGVYFIKAASGNGTKTFKVIKK